jgi:hypothetical protein
MTSLQHLEDVYSGAVKNMTLEQRRLVESDDLIEGLPLFEYARRCHRALVEYKQAMNRSGIEFKRGHLHHPV